MTWGRPIKADPSQALGAWFGLGIDMWMLGLESASVIALRAAKLAAGGAAAQAEANRMVSEKLAASLALSQKAALGGLGTTMPGIATTAVADYRRRVRANQRRLAKR